MAEEITYSIDDIIQGEVELEQEANIILGSASDQNCSYEQGYVYRQPIFSCLTCNESGTSGTAGGVCLACSLDCHGGHEVEELYTKRNFRCDCCNKEKFGHLTEMICLLQPNKSDANERNVYSDNFKGVYCICKKGYDGESEMIQCVLCEDWFHLEHCGLESSEGIDEFICPMCMEGNQFLVCYVDTELTERATRKIPKEGIVEDVTVEESKEIISLPEGNDVLNQEVCVVDKPDSSPQQQQQQTNILKRKTQEEEPGAKRLKESICKIENFSDNSETSLASPGIFNSSWREELCRCESCILKYKTHKIEYLLEHTDTITHYEQQAKDTNSFSNSIQAFSEIMTPIQRNEMLYQYNHMKEDLSEFLKPFALEGKAVSSEDIKRFFEKLTKEKDNLKDIGFPPDTCK